MSDAKTPPGPEVEMARIEADIERTREDLTQTVDELAQRLNVKRRVQDRLTDDRGRPAPPVLAVGAVAVLALATVVVVRWRRR